MAILVGPGNVGVGTLVVELDAVAIAVVTSRGVRPEEASNSR